MLQEFNSLLNQTITAGEYFIKRLLIHGDHPLKQVSLRKHQ